MSLNKCMLIGRVGQIEVKSFDGKDGEKKCATFSLATTERYKGRDGNVVENTEWHNIVTWTRAEFCEKWVQKGSQLYVEGKLRTRSWDDQNGKRYVTEILTDNIQLLGNKKESEQKPTPQPTPVHHKPVQSTPLINGVVEPEGDDLPF